jgi:DNA-binding NtrC family response regulator
MDPNKPTILVIEDDLSQLQLAEEILKEEGYAVLPCKSGIMAMDFLERSSVDLIVSDIRMPDIDMNHLLGYLAIHYARIPVIITTAYPEYEVLVRKSGNTVRDFFQKPLDYERLKTSIAKHLSHAQPRAKWTSTATESNAI